MTISDKQLVEAARAKYHKSGSVEVDEGADVSQGALDGAYVQAWVWVNFSDIEQEQEA